MTMTETLSPLWQDQFKRLEAGLKVLHDKPEETVEVCLQALWLKAAGIAVSPQRADQVARPELDGAQAKALADLVTERLDGVPLSYITGRQSFMGLEFITNPGAMIPRKETEILGRTAIDLLDRIGDVAGGRRVIDICTGSGNLPVVYATHDPEARVGAADLSEEAVALARENAKLHGVEGRVELRAGDLLAPFDTAEFHGTVDLLTCNPPYISDAKVEELPEEIGTHEPRMAFAGGSFGIDIPKRLIADAPRLLKPGTGWLAFEIGLGQGPFFLKRLQKNPEFTDVEGVPDENGDIRVLAARKA
ncbi:MAG: peptide chain release factor N(5)-glutamine methyltransferase [Maritimibacter sp.]|nr:peptide chain release factor N(5)-glutamine methyltransferase [Maritimibacter sp.]